MIKENVKDYPFPIEEKVLSKLPTLDIDTKIAKQYEQKMLEKLKDYDKEIQFSFLRDDLLDKNQDFNQFDNKGNSYTGLPGTGYGADLVPQVGDIITYNDGYYEVHEVIANQYFVGKNPDYPNNPNPINLSGGPGDLSAYGSSISIICKAHYVQADKLGLTQARYI